MFLLYVGFWGGDAGKSWHDANMEPINMMNMAILPSQEEICQIAVLDFHCLLLLKSGGLSPFRVFAPPYHCCCFSCFVGASAPPEGWWINNPNFWTRNTYHGHLLVPWCPEETHRSKIAEATPHPGPTNWKASRSSRGTRWVAGALFAAPRPWRPKRRMGTTDRCAGDVGSGSRMVCQWGPQSW